jgi:hypothetical protein
MIDVGAIDAWVIGGWLLLDIGTADSTVVGSGEDLHAAITKTTLKLTNFATLIAESP